jgi:hypothetical protein
MPDTSNPAPRKAEEHDQALAAAELTDEEFHKLADQYLEKLMTKLEQKQDEKGEIDAELSVSLLDCTYRKANLIRIGWSIEHRNKRSRHYYHQQTTTQQTDMAGFTNIWSSPL